MIEHTTWGSVRSRSIRLEAILFVFVFLVMFLFSMVSAEAAVYFVRQGATGTGNGADWTNAYSSLPSSLERGSTYYIADGSYGSHTFNDSESSSTYIYIKKATSFNHGTETGWSSTYGDGTAAFSKWSFASGYYDIDGQTGGGPASWDSGFGITVSATKGYRVEFASGVDHVTIKHTEITNTDNAANDVNFGHLINAQTNVSYLTFSYCKIHHVFGCVFKSRAGNDNWTVEYSKIGDNTGTSANHSEIWSIMGSDNITVRYSWLFKWRSTGGIIAINGSEGRYGDNEICENWNIYGNVFKQDGTTASWMLAAIDDASNQQVARNWTVVSNTFIDLNSTANSVYLAADTYGESNNMFVNNIFYGNSDLMVVSGYSTEDYNAYQGSGQQFRGGNDILLTNNPFVNYSGGDYRLSVPMGGMTLTSPYTTDGYGNIRGADGTWDRGAFEFNSGSAVILPSPPTNLFVVQ